MNESQHLSAVFSSILPENLTNLRHAQQILTPEHFHSNKHARVLWEALADYSASYGGVATETALLEMLSNEVSRADLLVIQDMIKRYIRTPGESVSSFQFSVDYFHDQLMAWKTGQAIAVGFEILQQSYEHDGELLSGHQDSRDYLTSRLREVEAEFTVGDASEGDATSDSDFVETYEQIKADRLNGVGGGVEFGIGVLDEHIGGVLPGDLVLVAAYTGQGKTQSLCQMAWHAAVNQNKNVFFSTTETVRRQVHARVIARHSRQPQFNIPNGLNSRHILKGTLSEEHEALFRQVVADLQTGDYGSLMISQTPHDATLPYVSGRVEAWKQHSQLDCDLLLIDSVYLLHAMRKRTSEREEMNELLRDTKRLATSMGVPIVTPWQITRRAWDEARQSGAGYSKSSLSDTSEAEKSASILVTFQRDENIWDSIHMRVLKNRDGEELGDQVLVADFSNAYLSSDDTPGYTEGVAPRTQGVLDLVSGGVWG